MARTDARADVRAIAQQPRARSTRSPASSAPGLDEQPVVREVDGRTRARARPVVAVGQRRPRRELAGASTISSLAGRCARRRRTAARRGCRRSRGGAASARRRARAAWPGGPRVAAGRRRDRARPRAPRRAGGAHRGRGPCGRPAPRSRASSASSTRRAQPARGRGRGDERERRPPGARRGREPGEARDERRASCRCPRPPITSSGPPVLDDARCAGVRIGRMSTAARRISRHREAWRLRPRRLIVLEADWLGACRRAAEGLRAVLGDHPTSRERVVETGERGEGGDRTLVIDAAAEDAVFAELERLHATGARFTRGVRGARHRRLRRHGVLVVIDPIDGSLNAKRGLTHQRPLDRRRRRPDDGRRRVRLRLRPRPARGVAGRPRRGRVPQRRAARRPPARAAPLRRPARARRHRVGRPALARAASSSGLGERHAACARSGSIAISLCQVAATRVDGMATLWKCRAVDAAAAQLIVRESGGVVAFTGEADRSARRWTSSRTRPSSPRARREALAELATVPRVRSDVAVDWRARRRPRRRRLRTGVRPAARAPAAGR